MHYICKTHTYEPYRFSIYAQSQTYMTYLSQHICTMSDIYDLFESLCMTYMNLTVAYMLIYMHIYFIYSHIYAHICTWMQHICHIYSAYIWHILGYMFIYFLSVWVPSLPSCKNKTQTFI